MKLHLTSRLGGWIVACAGLAAVAVSLRAGEAASFSSGGAPRELAIVIGDTPPPARVHTPYDGVEPTRESAYERAARIFPEVLAGRKWPLSFTTSRLTAGQSEHPLELRILLNGKDDSTVNAAVTLIADGKHYDLGVFHSPYAAKPFENYDGVMDRLYRRAANEVADKMSAVLFPEATSEAKREMVIQISESISQDGATSPYQRMARVFPEEFERRQWPFSYTTERLAAGTVDHPLQLKVYFEGIRHDLPGELHFRAWVTLLANGREHDFGMIRAVYEMRMNRPMDQMLDDVTREESKLIAAKVEAVLFPDRAKNK